MAIIDKNKYKLDIYDNKVANNLFSCDDDEKYCKSMLKKLVFYDRTAVLDLHMHSIMEKNVKYDINTLDVISPLDKDESYEKVIPLDKNWIGVFFCNKKTKQRIDNKMMYISPDGDGFVTDDTKSALNGYVPEYVYEEYVKDYPYGRIDIDQKYLDGSHDEFLKKLYDIVRSQMTDIFAKLFDNPNIKLEEVMDIVKEGLKKDTNSEEYKTCRTADDIFYHFGMDYIIDFDKKYYERHPEKIESQKGEE